MRRPAFSVPWNRRHCHCGTPQASVAPSRSLREGRQPCIEVPGIPLLLLLLHLLLRRSERPSTAPKSTAIRPVRPTPRRRPRQRPRPAHRRRAPRKRCSVASNPPARPQRAAKRPWQRPAATGRRRQPRRSLRPVGRYRRTAPLVTHSGSAKLAPTSAHVAAAAPGVLGLGQVPASKRRAFVSRAMAMPPATLQARGRASKPEKLRGSSSPLPKPLMHLTAEQRETSSGRASMCPCRQRNQSALRATCHFSPQRIPAPATTSTQGPRRRNLAMQG
mmetsp:Transcript_171176/g.548710  ORF Transcript_171176/g.548710 Transcript_171176/m.548710 type:complete len:275 (-) Transcript_171176:781-1605(-)